MAKENTTGKKRRKARYIMIGGFLGAGKTTAIGKLAAHLTAQGRKVGLITNDQAGGLVDTRVLRAQGLDARARALGHAVRASAVLLPFGGG